MAAGFGDNNGGNLDLESGAGGSSSSSGKMSLRSSAGGATGDVILETGSATQDGSGAISVRTGAAAGAAGRVDIAVGRSGTGAGSDVAFFGGKLRCGGRVTALFVQPHALLEVLKSFRSIPTL